MRALVLLRRTLRVARSARFGGVRRRPVERADRASSRRGRGALADVRLVPAVTPTRGRSGSVALALATVVALICTPVRGAQTGDERVVPSTASPPSPQGQPSVLVTSLLSGGFSLLGTLLALTLANRNTRLTIDASRSTTEASNNQRVNEAELSTIRSKLDTFYAPYIQRSGENRLLARQVQAGQPPGFRILMSLLQPGWFEGLSTADRTIVDEIVANGLDLRALIPDRSGVTDPVLFPYLALAGTHFTLLELARKGALEGEPERFRGFVSPRQLDPVLRLDIDRLERRAALLRSSLLVTHAPIDVWAARGAAPRHIRTTRALRGSHTTEPTRRLRRSTSAWLVHAGGEHVSFGRVKQLRRGCPDADREARSARGTAHRSTEGPSRSTALTRERERGAPRPQRDRRTHSWKKESEVRAGSSDLAQVAQLGIAQIPSDSDAGDRQKE